MFEHLEETTAPYPLPPRAKLVFSAALSALNRVVLRTLCCEHLISNGIKVQHFVLPKEISHLLNNMMLPIINISMYIHDYST
jgi:hypothetical protein